MGVSANGTLKISTIVFKGTSYHKVRHMMAGGSGIGGREWVGMVKAATHREHMLLDITFYCEPHTHTHARARTHTDREPRPVSALQHSNLWTVPTYGSHAIRFICSAYGHNLEGIVVGMTSKW